MAEQILSSGILNLTAIFLGLLLHAYYFGERIGKLEQKISNYHSITTDLKCKVDELDDRVRMIEKNFTKISTMLDNLRG